MRIFSRSNYSFVIWSVIWAKLNWARTWSNAAHRKYFRFAHNLVAKFLPLRILSSFFSFIAFLFHISFDIYFVPTCLFLVTAWLSMNELQCLFRFHSFFFGCESDSIFYDSHFSFFVLSFSFYLFCTWENVFFFAFLLILPSSHFFQLLNKSQLNGKNVHDFQKKN